jgi:hypothetical protein
VPHYQIIMGFLKRITPKNPPHIPFISKPAPKIPPEDPDDEATWFTTFMVIYFGFFGITLLVYPQVHTSQQFPFPFDNPIAYFTKMSEETAMPFRLAASFMLAMIGGPFCDEIFGTIGVKMKAFSMQMFLVNTLLFFVFMFYSFYDPLSIAISLIWKAQAYFNAFLFAWSIIEVTETANLVKYYTAFTAVYFGGFAVMLSSVPDLVFFTPSVMAYWTGGASELAMLTARSLGLGILILAAYGYFYVPTNSLCKMFTAFNVVNLGLFIYAAHYLGPMAITPMWEIQTCAQVPLVLIGLYLESVGATGAWSLGLSVDGGLNVSTMNLIDLAWFIPFTIGFFTVPNMLFGPAAITGVPMFTVDLDPVALWFGKAWGLTLTILALGPYVFSVPGAKVAKQMTFIYGVYVANFIYGLLNYEAFNFPIIVGLTSVNFILFALHVYVVLPDNAGEPML